MGPRWLRLLAICCGPLGAGLAAQSPGASDDLRTVLERVGASVERYFARAQSIVCLETVTVQFLGRDLAPGSAFARRLQYETRMGWDATGDGAVPEPTTRRELIKVGNRPPGPKDKPRCFDPKGGSPEPLAMLLPANQQTFSFSSDGRGRVNDRQALRLAYKSLQTGPITSKTSGPDCWTVETPGRERGRFWIDVETGEILRHDTWLEGLIEVDIPNTRGHVGFHATFERVESTTTYRPMVFADPAETIMLPHSAELLQVMRDAENVRVRHVFSDYRRFLTSGRIIQD